MSRLAGPSGGPAQGTTSTGRHGCVVVGDDLGKPYPYPPPDATIEDGIHWLERAASRLGIPALAKIAERARRTGRKKLDLESKLDEVEWLLSHDCPLDKRAASPFAACRRVAPSLKIESHATEENAAKLLLSRLKDRIEKRS